MVSGQLFESFHLYEPDYANASLINAEIYLCSEGTEVDSLRVVKMTIS